MSLSCAPVVFQCWVFCCLLNFISIYLWLCFVFGLEARLRLTAAERQARHRNKLKECGDYENYKKAHAEQQRKMRYRRKEREKLLPEAEQLRLLRERREKTKKRVAKWRALQKQKFEQQFSQQLNSTQNLPACKMEPMTWQKSRLGTSWFEQSCIIFFFF